MYCDIKIFEKLLDYVSAGAAGLKIDDAKNSINVLVCAEYLGIDTIVEKCLVYIAKHLEEIVRLPAKLTNQLKPSLLERLATKVALPELATIRDPANKLAGKLYQRKLTELVDCCSNDSDEETRL